jgi:hypothetical protein
MSKRKFKLGLDLHGVANALPKFFSKLTKVLIQSGFEVHIITGKHIRDGVKEELKNNKISYTHIFSIADYHESIGTKMNYDENNEPWISRKKWNGAKGKYCKKNKIDIHIDDSDIYNKHFKTPYAQVFINLKKEKNGKCKKK